MNRKKEVKASHILVKTLDEAKELKARLLAGENFGKLAEEFSFCPSGKRGGTLGYITKGQTVPNFEKAAFSLPEGEISEPVETEFGWHLIKVEKIVY
ncbi:MAG: peptidylprolyl isomerase [Candidatus Melainabacteria bacterium GWF2_37_15]|nr:MAG: peptidylprolyl isomerase [Candidatus Melainabacteria bacterium GWF2_37_15]